MNSDLQRRYQPNMLLGHLIVAGLAVALALGLKFQGEDQVTIPVTPRTLADLIQSDRLRAEGREGRQGSVPGFSGGFFRNLVTIPDGSVEVTHFTVPSPVVSIAALSPVMLDSGPVLNEGPEFGKGSDDGNYGFPEASVAYAGLSTSSGIYDYPRTYRHSPKARSVGRDQ